MTREQAIQRVREIMHGGTVDRRPVTSVIRRGELALERWDEPVFALGFEYGFMAALVESFQITREELYGARTDSGRFYNLPGESLA